MFYLEGAYIESVKIFSNFRDEVDDCVGVRLVQ